MTQEEFFKFYDEFTQQARAICVAKNTDYTGASKDALANFKLVEAAGITTTEVGMLTRFCDKLSRIATFVSTGEYLVKDESVDDTLRDMVNYIVLIAAAIKERKDATESKEA